jgi:AcrR family transcriptional regulator
LTGWSPPGGAEPASRRAPFSSNPTVGERGRATQRRIFDAAMRCFDELGYERSTVTEITKAAGCSRAAFYQYFSGREELFRQVAAQAAEELSRSSELLGPVTPDEAGLHQLREWVARHNSIYDRFEPVFRAYDEAVELDEQVAGDTAVLTERYARQLRAKLTGASLPRSTETEVVTLVNRLVTRAKRLTDLMTTTSAHPALDEGRVVDAVADVIHRTLFGVSDVNARAAVAPDSARREPLSTAFLHLLDADPEPADLSPSAQRTFATMLEASQRTLLAKGFHRTRVSEITQAAGLSHGLFYHYFSGKEEVTRVLAIRGLRRLVEAYERMPPLGEAGALDPAELRGWLADYGASHAREARMIRVWIDSTGHDPALLADAAAGLEWARQWMADVLAPRGFGDPAADALVLVTLLELLGAFEPSTAEVEAVALCVERAFAGSAPGATPRPRRRRGAGAT